MYIFSSVNSHCILFCTYTEFAANPHVKLVGYHLICFLTTSFLHEFCPLDIMVYHPNLEPYYRRERI